MQIVPSRTFLVCVAIADEHRDRFKPRLVDETISDPDRFEDARIFGEFGSFDQLANVCQTEQRAAIRQAQSPSNW